MAASSLFTAPQILNSSCRLLLTIKLAGIGKFYRFGCNTNVAFLPITGYTIAKKPIGVNAYEVLLGSGNRKTMETI